MYYDHLHDLLRERGFIIYAGQAQLEQSIFRVANMGALTEADLNGFMTAFEAILPEAQKLGAERAGEMERLGADRKEKAEREKAEEEAAAAAAKAEEEAKKAEATAKKAEIEDRKAGADPEVKAGA